MKVSEVLIAAKALIVDPANWTQGAYARTTTGKVCHIAVGTCYCSLGALKVTQGFIVPEKYKKYLENVMKCDIAAYNDSHTHAEVMKKWDEAIALAQLEGN